MVYNSGTILSFNIEFAAVGRILFEARGDQGENTTVKKQKIFQVKLFLRSARHQSLI